MKVYRITKSKYAADLSGIGAEINGGRWNSVGTALLYTAANRALAAFEVAVHTGLSVLPKDLVMVEIELPEVAIKTVEKSCLPNDWASPKYPQETTFIGDRFVKEGTHLIAQVPSAVIKGDFNYLVNSRHHEFSKVKVLSQEPFEFDSRLFL